MADELTQKSDPIRELVNDNTQPSRINTTDVSLLASPSTVNKKARDGSHGLKFESKLLALFCIRGLGAGYKFELGKENEDLAGKFDDVIFRYEVADETSTGKHWRYQYLQAKHKENENNRKITANDLLDPKGNGQFSLKKYFLSYCKMRVRGDDVRDCIVCTNWGVNEEKFNKIKLEEVKEQHILKFSPSEKTTRIYKLQIDQVLRKETIKLLEVSDIEALGVTDPLFNDKLMVRFWDKTATNLNEDQVLTVDLITEKVMDSKSKKFYPNFLDDKNLSFGAQKFRQKICEVIDDFYKKLIFVVDMPNEIQFKQIIETEEVNKYYHSDKCKVQTSRIFDEISDAFEKKSANFWLTSEEGKKILLAGVADVSLEYQRQLEKMVGFNEDSIKIMEKKLRQVIGSPGNKKVQRIATPSPQHTAVKVISAIQILLRKLKQEGNYLVTSSSRLQDKVEIQRWKNILKLQKGFNHFFIVVCDDEESVENNIHFISGDKVDDINFIIISRDGALNGMTDEIKYTDLSEDFQNLILTRAISFQGENLTVRDLVGDKPEEVIDFTSIKELFFEKKEVKIPPFNTSSFEQSLYVKRRLKFPFDGQFELSGECRISSDGHIKWFVEKEKRREAWTKIVNAITNQTSSSCKTVKDNHLMNLIEKGKEKSVVIISGVAGSGKSTLLSHYYDEIKKAKPCYWVIRINLLDHYQAIFKLDDFTVENAFDFFTHQLQVVDVKNSFSRSLLHNRMETGDRIVFMFDGFDEINDQCQEKAIELMKTITKEKPIQLYATTRTHLLDKLQWQLSQLAYNLDIFSEKDQIDFLASYWEKELNISGDKDESLQQFAESLVERVSKTLKDEDKSFIGIPLQCRILAECFQSNVKEWIEIQNSTTDDEEFVGNKISCLLNDQKFDLISLYDRLMETKRKVFREEKSNATNPNQIVGDAIDHLLEDIENHQTKLAIETIVTDQKIAEVLLPPQSSHRSDEEVAREENRIALNGLKFGLTFKSEDNAKIQFLHRTYAEYLFARYLYKGFHLDGKRHNKLLENAPSQKIILNKILAMKQYDGVQTFFDSMLKELVDDDEEWRDRVVQRHFPNRLNKFAENLFTQFLRQSPPLHAFGYQMMAIIKSYFVNALYHSLANGKGSIFEFLCDCLDATFDKQQVQWALLNSFVNSNCYFSLEFFCNKESKLFKRFINYFHGYQPASNLFSKLTLYSCGLPPCDLKYSQWNGEDQQKVVNYLLEFMDNEREAFEKNFGPHREINIKHMLTFFIFNEYYESHLKIFLELLSRSPAYSDDSKFANLLKKAICSKMHFKSGRIEKVLITLRELERQNLLTQLYGIVLAIEPEAFQSIYQPLPLVVENVRAMKLNILLKQDSYRTTVLHRAAFYGDTECFENILKKIRQNLDQENGFEKVANVMARDEYGFTPFYVAAALGKEEIYGKMLAVLKETLPAYALKENLVDTKGFVHFALSNAIESENVEMFSLILNAIKCKLGQDYLINLLKTNGTTVSRFSTTSFFVKSKTKELFNAMARIVVTRDDNVSDYTDLHDLVFHDDATKRDLQYIDAETLQGLLSLKGVDDFSKRVLDKSSYLLSNAFQLISNHLLKHFTKDQLEQFVQTITCKNNTTKNRSNIYAERVVPICYWRDFIQSALTAHRDSRGFVSREDVHCIFDCLKHAGDCSAKKLLLHEDEYGFIMIQLSQTIVKLMLNHLSKENQEEVKQQWKNNAPPMRSFFVFTSVGRLSIGIARYCSDILRFYLNYGSENHLNEFADVVTFLKNTGEVEFSVWSCVFEKLGKEETNEILTLVSEKVEILGQDAVKKLLLHEIDQVPFVIKSFLEGEDVDAWLEILPKEIKREIQQFIEKNAPEFLGKAVRDLKTFFKTLSWRQHYNKLNTFTFFLNYQSDKIQLEQFMQNIMSSVDGENARSIWAELLTHECEDHKTDDIAKMDKFLEVLSEKLGSTAVKELVLHKDGEKPVICYHALRGEEKMLETMLNHLSAKDRKKVLRQVEKFLDETFKIPPDGDSINNYALCLF